MVKPAPNYFLVLLMFLIAAAGTYWVSSKPVKVLYNPDMDSFPRSIGSWNGNNLDLDAETKKVLDADEVLFRKYASDSSNTDMGLLVVFRKFGRRGFAHRPEMCYPASGWEIISKSYTTVPYGGKNIQAFKVVAQKDNAKEIIVYWFASGQQVEANFAKQQLWMSLDRLKTKKYGWAFIRINSPVVSTEDDTMKQIRSFVRTASSPLMSTLTGSQVEGVAGISR